MNIDSSRSHTVFTISIQSSVINSISTRSLSNHYRTWLMELKAKSSVGSISLIWLVVKDKSPH